MWVPSIIEEALSGSAFIFYYGEPSSGKTCLARLFIDTLKGLGFRYCYVATESGSIAVGGAERVFAVTMEHLAEVVFKCLANGISPVIDTINAYYTGALSDARLLSFISATARAADVPVVAAGQVTSEGRPRGGTWIIPWADYVGLVKRVRSGTSALYIEKPHEAVVAFRISGGVRGRICWT